MSTLHLLYPEWQGSGKSRAVRQGALTIARTLFPETGFLVIDAPADERLYRRAGVFGLDSIGPRFRDAIGRVRALAPDRIVTIGGTCGVEAAPVAYLNERYGGNLAVVWLDAHGDLNTPASSPSGNFHGMILRTLLGDGPAEYVRELKLPLHARQLFLAATRDLDPPEAAFIDRAAISITAPAGFDDPGRLVDAIRARGFEHAYLHLDLDALDPDEFADTLVPTAGGPSLQQVRLLLRTLARSFDVVGASIVEYVPNGDASLRIVDDLRACFCPS